MRLTLVVLAAGMSSRYGRLKQLEPVGPDGEALMDYSVFDAIRAGFSKAVFVIREEIEPEMRTHIEPRFSSAVQCVFTYQSLDDVPAGFAAPPKRKKPWGTAHAVLAAEPDINGPFAVCNSDDYYGPSAYRMLVAHFAGARSWGQGVALDSDQRGSHVLIGYRLCETLSDFGGVSRAVCRTDPAGCLEQIVEVRQIEKHREQLVGIAESGERIPLSGGETVSMNLWGFTTALLPLLRRQFADFLRAHGTSANDEFLIPTALHQQVARNQARLRVLQASERWMGMTFTQDRSKVAQRISELVSQGCYPKSLAAELHNSQKP